VVVEAWQLPTEPLKPFYVRAGGIETQFLADGASWQWDADQLVVSCDGILCGATGRVPTERVVPWVPAMVDLAGLPAVGAPTVSSGPVPANTIATPAGFNAARPRGIWALLPTNGTDAFEEYRDPAYLFRPFTPVVADQLTMLITISEVETPYSLLPIDEGQEELVVVTFITEVSYVAVLVKLPLTTITVTALAPAVESTASMILPLTTITVTTLAPVVESPGSVILPLTTIAVTALAPVIGVTDPDLSSVSLLLPFDGANDSTTITDYSPNPKTLTVYGSARIRTEQSQWGGSSFRSFGGADALQATSSDFAFGTGVGTVEFWLRPILSNATNFGRIIQVGDFPLAGAWQLVRQTSTNPLRLLLDLTTGSGTGLRLEPTTTLSSSAFTHVALTFNRPTVSIYVAGTSVASGSYNYNLTRTDLSILNDTNRNIGLDAWIDDLRITKGVVRYTGNFTPPPGPFPLL
jgi:hypothetical protein